MNLTQVLLLASILSTLPLTSFAEWKNFRGNYRNHGHFDRSLKEIVQNQKRLPHFYQTKGLIWGSAVEDEKGQIFVGSADKNMYAFTHDLMPKWSNNIYDKADSLIDSAAALTPNGLVVVPGGDGYLHAFDKETGERVWEFQASDRDDSTHQSGVIVNSFEGNVTISPHGLIYAGSDNGHMYCLDLNGKLLWSLKTDMMIWSSPSFTEDGLMVFGSLDKKLYLVDAWTGKVFDTFKVKSEIKASPVLVNEIGVNYIYVGDSDGDFFKFMIGGKKSAKIVKKWKVELRDEIYSSAAYKDGHLYFGSRNGFFYKINSSGKVIWKYDTYSSLASSPIITKDDVVIFGAKNGKIYALDALKGERIYSFRTDTRNIRVNLDASPLITSHGVIINGSYSGKIHSLPFEYCLNAKEDSRCEFGGTEDLPEYARGHLAKERVFYYENRDGNLFIQPEQTLNQSETIQLKLVAMDRKGHFIKNAGINPLGIKVMINGVKSDNYRVSSDGKYLNIYPRPFFTEDLNIEVQGTFYRKTHWLADRFKYVFLPKFKASILVKINTEKNADNLLELSEVIEKRHAFGIRNMFLMQPQSMETYIPAALDGQNFIVMPVSLNQKSGKMLSLVLPAFQTKGVYTTMPEPSKSFVLEGDYLNNEIHLLGKFKLSAMGGTIPFEIAHFNGVLTSQGLQDGLFFTQAKCTQLQGNGSDFTFSPNLIDETCDHKLRLIAFGKYESDLINLQDTDLGSEINVSRNISNISISISKEASVLVNVVTIYADGNYKHKAYNERDFVNGNLMIQDSSNAQTLVYVNGKLFQ